VNPLSNAAYLLPPLFATAITVALLTMVLLRARRSLSTWLFCGVLLSVALWSLLTFGMRSSPDVYRAVFWARGHLVTGFAIYILFYHFTSVYADVRGQRTILVAAYLLFIVAAVVAPTDLLIREMRIEDYGYAPVLGPVAVPLAVSGLPFLGVAIYNLLRRYKVVSRSYEERNRALYLMIAPMFPILGSLLDGFTNLPPTLIWGNLIFCIVCSVAILKYHLLDISLVIRKGIAYLLMSIAVAIPYVGTILLFNRLFEQAVPFWAHLIFLLLLALALQPLWQRVQRLVDKFFYRERYDFLKELQNFSQETHDISGLNQLISSLVKLISRALQSPSVYLLLTSASGDFVTVSSTGESAAQLTIESGSPLLRWLRSNKGILRRQALDTIPQLQSLTSKETSELEKIRAKLFVPLKTKGKELVGVVILSEKLSAQPYSTEDERVILTVASRMAFELENARLYALERITRKELERQDKQKTEFLHSVAHELKTPLTAIIASSELLSTELSSTSVSQRQRLIRSINQSAWSMDKRVTLLFDFAKMQVGDLRLRQEPLEIGLIIKEMASRLRALFKNKEQSLKLEVPGSLPQVKADREKLEQIIVNLLSNANKFSPTGSKITLGARELDNRIIVEVKDSAPAITEEEKVKLFDPYYRGGDADKRQRVPGLGLGLAISRKLVELHQGELWVVSEPRRGNTFAFSLPTYNRE